jgi:hypothetical protein
MPMTADQGTMMVHSHMVRDAVPAGLGDFFPLKGMTHYFHGQPEGFTMATDAVTSWLIKRALAPTSQLGR